MLHIRKAHLATEKDFVPQHSLKINKRWSPNKLRGVGKKIEKLMSDKAKSKSNKNTAKNYT